MPLRILLVSLYYPPEITAPAFRWGETAAVWAELGAEVTVLTCLPSYPTGQIDPRYNGLESCEEWQNGVRVIRVPTVPAVERGAISRFYSQLAFYFNGKYAARGLGTFDVIVGTSPPLTAAELAAHLAHRSRRPFVMEVRDLWPDLIIDTGIAKARPIMNLLYRWERRLYRRAQHIVTVTPSFVPLLEGKGTPAARISVVPPGVLPGPARTLDSAAAKARLGLAGKTVALYLGNHGISQGLDVIVEAAASLDAAVHLLFVGEGWEKPGLIERARQLELVNVTFLPAVPKQDTQFYYDAADVCLVPLRGTGLLQHFLPSKLLEILACGCPVLTNIGGEGARIVRETGAGVVLEEYSATSVAQALNDWPREAQRWMHGAVVAREYVIQHFDRRKLAVEYLEILQRVVASTHGTARADQA